MRKNTSPEQRAKQSAYMRKWNQEHPPSPEKRAKQKENALKHYYSLTPEQKAERARKSALWKAAKHTGISAVEYDTLLDKNEGRCAICGSGPSEKRLSLDHDHKTGKPREFLCNGCNTGIGLMRDSPDLLRLAAMYIERHSEI